jgi:predicted RNase H-like nuclease (RuvC/YqgF family)
MGRPPIGETAMTSAERVRRYRLKHAPVTKPVTKLNGTNGGALANELAQAEARISALEGQLARAAAEIAELNVQSTKERKRREAAEAKAAAMPRTEAERDTEAERVMKRLRQQLKEARSMRRHLEDWCKKSGVPEKGGMTRATYTKLVKVLHPDGSPSEAERADACRAFNVWADNLKRR